jgi:hypothetical protein
MAFDGSTLLSRLDLSDVEAVKDADHELRRATTDADLAGWARKWGGASMHALLSPVSRDDIEDSDEYREVSDDLTALENTTKGAIEDLENALKRDDLPGGLDNELSEIIADLERTLREGVA